VVHTVAVALGLAAVFAASAIAFTVLKLVGAAYLLYLAWQAFHAPASSSAVDAATEPRMFSMYLRGVMMNLTNPKVVFFFLAFLPQFVRPEQGPVATQILWLGLLFILSTLLSFGLITVFASAISQRLRGSAKAQQILNRAAALVFCGLALRLALAER
jgi:threonine/homoserine/homoserine lactone efflux protein